MEHFPRSSYIQRIEDSVAAKPLPQKTVLGQVFVLWLMLVSNPRFSSPEGDAILS
ncbi:hypothetical protein GS511_12830 [Leptospira borgpetersenii]|nr:hypothetical protein GS524_12825 [Leptospira borgpetersenii]QHE31062.1 hypothetical protein GS523_12830 [Leptospira borgpetersenii]QHE34365.1 hypothetical protein GS517_12820 [Leptospira borgpetersenii]QHE37595.1 hypothetical protein GS510_12465 [Leptospira borgpetersenii]QHE40957.1 hypothetical protein GS527_13120 [Leptospira borgpetersenii]